MLKVKDTELLQENVIGLVAFAQRHEFLNLNGDSESPVVRETFSEGRQSNAGKHDSGQEQSGRYSRADSLEWIRGQLGDLVEAREEPQVPEFPQEGTDDCQIRG